mmetsp:Transcript_353/g.769  ORF Transcript_353/g.769 Transcript_353/m.769 type:complete len:236 (+) Transcript_353:72-779(+)
MANANEAINHYKVVLLGEGRVGKTSILVRYVDGSYVDGRSSTMQASYLDKHIVIEDEVNYLSSHQNRTRREAQLSIWDTAGQERFHSLGPIYYRDAKGAVLVYDITDRPSFDRVRKWTKELRKMVGDTTKICLAIVGNKLDLERQSRAVDSEEAQKYAQSVGAAFSEVSAKTGSGVEDVFVDLTKKMLDTVKPSHRARSSLADASSGMGGGTHLSNADERVDLSQKNSENESKCC